METKRKAGRQRVQCLKCSKIFNEDYKKQHEKTSHDGRKVQVKMVGAPLNPFLSASSSKRMRMGGTPTSDSNALPHVEPNEQNMTIREGQMSDANVLPQSGLDEHCEPNTTKNTPTPSEPIVNSQNMQQPVFSSPSQRPTDLSELSEVDCERENSGAAKTLDELFIETVAAYKRLKEELADSVECSNKSTSSAVNMIPLVTQMVDSASRIKEMCEVVVGLGNKTLDNQKGSGFSFDNSSGKLVCHDPGLRPSILTQNERRYLISLGPHQPILNCYPSDGKNRFNPRWYKEYEHLEYSSAKDAAYCFVCCLFSSGPGRDQSEQAWVSEGVKKWGKMKSSGQNTGKLQKHFSCDSHQAALYDYCHFLTGKSHLDVLLDDSRRLALIEEERIFNFNKQVVIILFDICRTMGRQGLAFRGDGNEEESSNFLQICKLVSRHNSTLKRWFAEKTMRPYHVTYTSPESQNEIISLIGEKIERKIIDEINDAPFYTVMADTTPDASRKDMLSIIIRFTDSNSAPKERLLAVVEARDKTGAGLANTIADVLKNKSIPLDKLAFQSYDFARSMSGEFNGAQQKLTEVVKHNVPYIPCQAHRTNTGLEHACNASTIISEMFNIIQEIFVFTTSSTKRFAYFKDKLKEVENALQLKSLAQTRWTARAESVSAVVAGFEVVTEFLNGLERDEKCDTKTRHAAYALRMKMLSFDFVVSLYFMKNIIYKIKMITQILEGLTGKGDEHTNVLNVIDAVSMIQSLVDSLTTIREGDQEIDNLISSAIEFFTKVGGNAEEEFKKNHRVRSIPRRFDANPSTQAVLTLYEFYRSEFRKVLDTLIVFLQDDVKVIMLKLQPFFQVFQFPLRKSALTHKNLVALCNYIPSAKPDVDALKSEMEVLFDLAIDCKSISQLVAKSLPTKNALKLAQIVLRLIVTTGYSVASNERTFSSLKFVKNALRSSMGDRRLEALLLMQCEQDLVDSLEDPKELVEAWAKLKNRRIKLR